MNKRVGAALCGRPLMGGNHIRLPLRLMLIGLFLASSIIYAQEGPIGPVGPDTSPSASQQTDSDVKKSAVDLPYKPTVDQPVSDSRPDRTIEVVQKEIPYIPSKSPEPLGAPDPEIN